MKLNYYHVVIAYAYNGGNMIFKINAKSCQIVYQISLLLWVIFDELHLFIFFNRCICCLRSAQFFFVFGLSFLATRPGSNKKKGWKICRSQQNTHCAQIRTKQKVESWSAFMFSFHYIFSYLFSPRYGSPPTLLRCWLGAISSVVQYKHPLPAISNCSLLI